MTHPHRSRRGLRRLAASTVVAATVLGVAGVGLAPLAGASPSAEPRCLAATTARAKAAEEIARRQTTIGELRTSIGGTSDPYGTNGEQSAELQAASDGLAALGEKIATTCYTDRAALKADGEAIFYQYRIYALRVPQTKALEAADHLGDARGQLGEVSATLAGKVGDNAAAQAALDAMNAALAQYDTRVGAPGALAGAMAAVPGLEPAQDTGPTTAALQAARADLTAGRQALATARDEAKKAVEALKG
jgi:hypothetical protein